MICPFVSDIVGGNKVANIHNQVIPNLVQFFDELWVTFIPSALHPFIHDLERVHRDKVFELRGECVVMHRDLVAGDL